MEYKTYKVKEKPNKAPKEFCVYEYNNEEYVFCPIRKKLLKATIGRVAVYDFDFPAVVDGHITIVRFKDKKLAWYVAAYLMTEEGQRQIYRYINGSSGQVEIYPQDIARIWIKPATDEKIEQVYKKYQKACRTHDKFYRDLLIALDEV